MAAGRRRGKDDRKQNTRAPLGRNQSYLHSFLDIYLSELGKISKIFRLIMDIGRKYGFPQDSPVLRCPAHPDPNPAHISCGFLARKNIQFGESFK